MTSIMTSMETTIWKILTTMSSLHNRQARLAMSPISPRTPRLLKNRKAPTCPWQAKSSYQNNTNNNMRKSKSLLPLTLLSSRSTTTLKKICTTRKMISTAEKISTIRICTMTKWSRRLRIRSIQGSQLKTFMKKKKKIKLSKTKSAVEISREAPSQTRPRAPALF